MLAVDMRVVLQIRGKAILEKLGIRFFARSVIRQATAHQLIGTATNKAGDLFNAAIRLFQFGEHGIASLMQIEDGIDERAV